MVLGAASISASGCDLPASRLGAEVHTGSTFRSGATSICLVGAFSGWGLVAQQQPRKPVGFLKVWFSHTTHHKQAVWAWAGNDYTFPL